MMSTPTAIQPNSTDLLNAIDQNYRAAMRAFGLASHVKIREDDSVFWFVTGVPDSSYNSIMYANLKPEQISDMVRELRELRERYGVPMNWLVGPASKPTDLGERLVQNGLTHFFDLPLLSMKLDNLSESVVLTDSVRLNRVTTEQDWQDWIATEARGYEADETTAQALARVRREMGFARNYPIYYFLGRLEGSPVATASVVLDSNIAGIYDVTVVPSARRQGIGGAITRHALEFARQAGYQTAWLQASQMGFRLYQENGFRECGTCSIYG